MPTPRYVLVRAGVLLGLIAVLLFVRGFVAVPVVKDHTMLPTLWPGDRLLVYRDRVTPARGDVVVAGTHIGRVVGLPGERVAIRRGIVTIDGKPLPRFRIADLILPRAPNLRCPAPLTAGRCRLPRHREMADDRVWDVLAAPDTHPAVAVPGGRLLLLPDDRSRPPRLVPTEAVIGRAREILWSGDGRGSWRRFWRWGETLRPARILKGVERGATTG